jgi:hypothetical protein
VSNLAGIRATVALAIEYDVTGFRYLGDRCLALRICSVHGNTDCSIEMTSRVITGHPGVDEDCDAGIVEFFGFGEGEDGQGIGIMRLGQLFGRAARGKEAGG